MTTSVSTTTSNTHPNTTKRDNPKWPGRLRGRAVLTAHRNGQWCKKIAGKIHYFGAWADPDLALQRYLTVADQLHTQAEGEADITECDFTVFYLVNAFLNSKLLAYRNGELSARMYHDYRHLGELVITTFGKTAMVAKLRPEHFDRLMAKLSPSPTRRANEVTWVRSMFKTVAEAHGVLVRFGTFKKPPKRIIRKVKRERGEMLYSAEEIRRLLTIASPTMKAIILLGINIGFGNSDVSDLRRHDVKLDQGLIDMVRHKTEIPRLSPLWPETVEALKAYSRPDPANEEHHDRFFVTRWGALFVIDHMHEKDGVPDKAVRNDGVGQEFSKLCRKAGVKSRGFYALRHTFETIALETGDVIAVERVMGHVVGSKVEKLTGHAMGDMLEFYTERVKADNLWKVVNYVREWLRPWQQEVVELPPKNKGGRPKRLSLPTASSPQAEVIAPSSTSALAAQSPG